MAGHKNTKGNTGFLKSKFIQNLNAGEKLNANEFQMDVDGYPELSVLIRSTQMPAMGRADVEDFGANGLKFVQQGTLENSGEVTAVIAETLEGTAAKAIRNIIKNKEYVNITIRSAAESTDGEAPDPLIFNLEHCRIRSDVIEFSTEDQATIVKPSITIVYNWFDLD